MGNEPQTLTEMPLWVLILLAALGGVSGEMWRADKAGLGGWALLRRLALRSGASIVCGVAVMLLALACGAAANSSAALGSLGPPGAWGFASCPRRSRMSGHKRQEDR